MHYVYILKSRKNGRHYIGETKDLGERIKRDNSGRSKSTKGGIPWEIEIAVKVENKKEASKLERKIKRMKDPGKAKEYLEKWFTVVEHSDLKSEGSLVQAQARSQGKITP